jgi:GNAT superfamily N-acetyltransferase
MTGTGKAVVRIACLDDLDQVTAIFLACWRDSYADLLAPDVIAYYDDERAGATWRPLVEGAVAGRTLLVADHAERGILGFGQIGGDPEAPERGHVHSIYVHPDARGLGVGRLLLGAAVDGLRTAGAGEATLWVFAANTSARAFYARMGWEPDGTERTEVACREPELRLRRRLVPPRSGQPRVEAT